MNLLSIYYYFKGLSIIKCLILYIQEVRRNKNEKIYTVLNCYIYIYTYIKIIYNCYSSSGQICFCLSISKESAEIFISFKSSIFNSILIVFSSSFFGV